MDNITSLTADIAEQVDHHNPAITIHERAEGLIQRIGSDKGGLWEVTID